MSKNNWDYCANWELTKGLRMSKRPIVHAAANRIDHLEKQLRTACDEIDRLRSGNIILTL